MIKIDCSTVILEGILPRVGVRYIDETNPVSVLIELIVPDVDILSTINVDSYCLAVEEFVVIYLDILRVIDFNTIRVIQ